MYKLETIIKTSEGSYFHCHHGLMIGNIISYRGERVAIVENIGSTIFSTLDINGIKTIGSDDVRDYEPIVLNEDWLKNLGFDNDFYIDGLRLSKKTNNVFYDKSTSVHFNYVHELQNYYHVMTGNYLDITSL